jgi:hypothetical protein
VVGGSTVGCSGGTGVGVVPTNGSSVGATVGVASTGGTSGEMFTGGFTSLACAGVGPTPPNSMVTITKVESKIFKFFSVFIPFLLLFSSKWACAIFLMFKTSLEDIGFLASFHIISPF